MYHRRMQRIDFGAKCEGKEEVNRRHKVHDNNILLK